MVRLTVLVAVSLLVPLVIVLLSARGEGTEEQQKHDEADRSPHDGTQSVSRTATVCIMPACMW